MTAVSSANPISADMAVMRTSLWPGLLATAVHNLNRQQTRVRIFEAGQCFLPAKSEQIRFWAEPEYGPGRLICGHATPTAGPQQRQSRFL